MTLAVSASVLRRLELWEQSGGHVRFSHPSETAVVVELCTCTGEPMECISINRPALIAYRASRANAELSDL
jgi:hypothetical protein